MDTNRLWTEMKRYISPHIIDRGIEYYEQGLVDELEIKVPWVRAEVSGNYGDYTVKVHANDFSKSRCDCPYEDYCKHMAAVVYYVSQEFSEPADDHDIAGILPTALQVSSNAAQANPGHLSSSRADKQLEERLSSLEQKELYGILQQLMETVPSLRETIRLILIERERASALNADKVRHLQLYSALAYFQKEVPVILKECEALFVKNEANSEEDDDWEDRYRYGDEEEEQVEWDFAEGVERLLRLGQQLLGQVAFSHYISGTVGLLTAVVGLEDWIDRYDDEYCGSELTDGCSEFENYLWEALERVNIYRIQDPEAQTFLRELVEWIVQQCGKLDDLLNWTTILAHCTADLPSLWHLKERIVRLEEDFLQSANFDDERHRGILVHWWVELSLSLNHEDEAKQTAQMLNGSPQFDASLAMCFVNYYERQERWREAVAALQAVLAGSMRIQPHDYERIIRFCERAGDEQGRKEWLEKWFLAYPDFALFKQNATLIENDADRENRINNWIDCMRKQKQGALVISIYLHQGDLNQAWKEFAQRKDQFQMTEPLLLKLFKEMKKQDPAKLIPVYSDYIMKNIHLRERSTYARAARWMKDLKEVCLLSRKEEKWTAFYREIMTQYKRFRSLMEEIRAAGFE